MAQEFRRICQEALGFLGSYGFSDARLSGDPLIHSITARFYGKTLAIECIWDSREEALEVKVALLRDGKPPGDFAVDAGGKRVREHMTSWLLRRGVRGFGFRKVPEGTPLADRWRSLLEDYERLIKTHGDAVLREDPDVLD
jgi:hypothetical protein